MDFNFHTHTRRCGHATGTEREYIEAAIAVGVKEMGFSDHAPWIAPDLGKEMSYVVPYAKVEDYVNTVKACREEYRDRIAIHLGFEAEYDPVDPEEMIRLGAEYLILGQHFYKAPDGTYIYAGFYGYEHLLPSYVDAVIKGIRSGYYTYVAHPDVFNFKSDDISFYQKEMARLCEAAADADMPLEINFLGIREGRYYPNNAFLAMVKAADAPVTFGFDAHSPSAAADLASVPKAMALVEKYGLRYIGKPKLVRL